MLPSGHPKQVLLHPYIKRHHPQAWLVQFAYHQLAAHLTLLQFRLIRCVNEAKEYLPMKLAS